MPATIFSLTEIILNTTPRMLTTCRVVLGIVVVILPAAVLTSNLSLLVVIHLIRALHLFAGVVGASNNDTILASTTSYVFVEAETFWHCPSYLPLSLALLVIAVRDG
jgi:hypothetical protein